MLNFKQWLNENADIRAYLKQHGYNAKKWRKIQRAVDRDEFDIPGIPDLPVWHVESHPAFPSFLEILKELIPAQHHRTSFINILNKDAIAETAVQDLLSKEFSKKDVEELIETLREMKIYFGPPAIDDIKIWDKETPEEVFPEKDKPFQRTRI